MPCAHKDSILIERPSEAEKVGAVCEDCVAIGSDWVHLRVCRTCGHVGCCDESEYRHARAHWNSSDHPIISSMEPREVWTYCFIEDDLVD